MPGSLTTRLPDGLKERLTVRSMDEGHPSLSAAVVGLLELYANGEVSVPVAPVEPPNADRLEIGRMIEEDGVSIYAAAKQADVSWPTARRCHAEYLAMKQAAADAADEQLARSLR